MTSAARLPRFGILGLGGIIVVCGLGFAALRTPSPLVGSLVFTITLTILMVAALAVALGSARTFAIGFATFGWIYALIAFAPGAGREFRPYLLTSRLLEVLARRIPSVMQGAILYAANSGTFSNN